MKHMDYYKILGIARDGSPEDIQRAFRKRARLYHPDVCKETDAEERFKEINEAYSVLSDPEKRDLYDRYGEKWQQMKDFDETHGSQRDADTGSQRAYSDFGSFHGDHRAQKGFFYQTAGGADAEDINDILRNMFTGSSDDEFLRFNRQSTDMKGRSIQADLELSLDDLVQKRTRTMSIESGPSFGQANSGQSRKIEVKIPSGVTEGSLIRLKGQGEPGIGRGPAGDLLLKIRLTPDKRFEVNGYDLESVITLAPWEAVLGTKIDLETTGGRVYLTVPAGTQSDRRFRLKGKGLEKKKGHGDIYVRIRIDVPEKLSPEERELFDTLSRVSTYRPRGLSRKDTDMDRAA